MTVIVVSVNSTLFLLSYLCCCVKYIENDIISKDSVYYYSYDICNYDKEGSYFKYFSFIENIGITFIKKKKKT